MKEAVTEPLQSDNRSEPATVGAQEQSPLQQAEERILSDLVNALLAEGLWEEGGRVEIMDAAQLNTDSRLLKWNANLNRDQNPDLGRKASDHVKLFRWSSRRQEGHQLVFPVQPAIVQAYRYVTGGGVYEIPTAPGSIPARIGVLEVWRHMTEAIYPSNGHQPEGEPENGVTRLTKLLQLTLEQTRWTWEEHSPSSAGVSLPRLEDLAGLERLAALRDRPFHPVAKAKGGWTQADYHRYSAESGQPVTLQWIAVQRQHLLHSGGLREAELASVTCPVDLLLSSEERSLLREAMQRLELPEEQYIALPVHPWQLAVILPKLLAGELAAGDFVPLHAAAGAYYATSSARSLAPAGGGAAHVKLPLGIVSLGAVRYLPAVHMMNGERGQRLLEQARQRDAVLKERLSLCDETNWWAYLPETADYFDDPPRHLSALIRTYPSDIIDSEGTVLVPMSALAVHAPNGTHVLDAWMQMKGMQINEAGAESLFGEVCLHFLHLCLRLFRLGIMPEIHGQNAMLIVKHGHVSGMLLRDHDSVRLHLPWMNEHGLSDPCYKMKPGYPNSLYNETPQKLLFYLQTLGIQVNLYSILEAVADRYGIEESRLWHVLKSSLTQAVGLAELSTDVRAIVEQVMLGEASWPWKNLLKPLLEQEGVPSGSMPSGTGQSVNPFQQLNSVQPSDG